MLIAGTSETALAKLLAEAYGAGTALEALPAGLMPSGIAAALAVQQQFLKQRGSRIGGWKVGAPSPTGTIQAAPLPAEGIRPSPAAFSYTQFPVVGLELEIAFGFGRSFEPSPQAYTDAEVLAAVKFMRPTIEIVSSRYAQWPAVDKLWQLADLQNHGALVVGEAVEYRGDFAFAQPEISFAFEGSDIAPKAPFNPHNPAGDPRRLLPWLVNHCTRLGLSLTPETVITTGSYTGMYFPSGPGTAVGTMAGLPPITLTLI
jgi:2-keto-4-pentenoate hydratase